MTAKLIAEEGTMAGLVLSFDEGDEWVIGRDPDTCQLLVEDPEVSREHVMAHKLPEGISVENLSTTNPALVNDRPIKESCLLQHGDTLKIGSGIFRYYTDIGGRDVDPESKRKGKEKPAPEVHEEEEEEEETNTLFDDEKGDAEKMLANIDFNVSNNGRWMLKVIGGPNNGAEFSMEPGSSYVLGTNPDNCDIVFHDGTVSRQHAKLTISADNKLTIQDLKSRNGVFVDDKKIKGKADLVSNSIVSLGTTRVIIFDREADRQTLITPLLPSIVKSLKEEDSKKARAAATKSAPVAPVAAAPAAPPQSSSFFKKMVVLALIAGLILVVGMGTTSLFQTKDVVAPKVDTEGMLQKVMMAYPMVKYNYNEGTGSLLLIGHVLKSTDRAQLLYNLEALPFIREQNINDKNLIIDELLLQTYNQIIGKNSSWRGVSLTAPSAGRFVLNGYLSTRDQGEKLSDYMAQNFPYLDLLEKRVFVEEDEVSAARAALQDQGFKDVNVQMSGGELTLSGNIIAGRGPQLEKVIATLKKDAAVRSIKNYVIELQPENSVVDLSDTYKVTGSSNRGGQTVNVVINGRILSNGDLLDGMMITQIKRDAIFLEREGVKYKIEYNK